MTKKNAITIVASTAVCVAVQARFINSPDFKVLTDLMAAAQPDHGFRAPDQTILGAVSFTHHILVFYELSYGFCYTHARAIRSFDV